MKNILLIFVVLLMAMGFNSQPQRYWVAVADYEGGKVRNNFTFIIKAKDKDEATFIFENLKNKHIKGGMSLIDKSYLVSEINFEKAWGKEDVATKNTYWRMTK